MEAFADWLQATPKAELHLHIDGSLEPSRLLKLAAKHQVEIPYKTEADVIAAYEFSNLDEFLAMYYLGASVLRDEEDFYHLMMDYLTRCREQNIVHAEIMIEPQTYAGNGVPMARCMAGFKAAIAEAQAGWGQSVALILSMMRHEPEAACLETLKEADVFRDDFVGLGLASSEVPFPPEQFQTLYREAKARGYKLAAHAGEEGPPSYIADCLNLLACERIDHGIRCEEDEALVASLVSRQIPLTVCPLSNVKLRCFSQMNEHNVLRLLEHGLCVTVNSDDPAYFGGYLNENYIALADALAMDQAQATQLIRNSFTASYLPDEDKAKWLSALA